MNGEGRKMGEGGGGRGEREIGPGEQKGGASGEEGRERRAEANEAV